MKYLELSNGLAAIVDDDVFAWARHFKWHQSTYGYPVRNTGGGRLRTRAQTLHAMILGRPPEKLVTDHINGDKLDNRKENLRFVSRKLNNLNSRVRKGYYLHAGKWRVRFKVADIYLDVSGLETEEQAQNIAALLRGSLIYYELTKGGQNRLG